MANPFLYTLPKSALAAYPTLLRGARAGLSASAIKANLKAAGMNVGINSVIRPFIREVRRMERMAAGLRNLPRGSRIRVTDLPPATTRLRKNYSFAVRAVVRLADDTTIERYIQVGFDRSGFTPKDILSSAEKALMDKAEYDTVGIESLEIDSGSSRVNPRFAPFEVG